MSISFLVQVILLVAQLILLILWILNARKIRKQLKLTQEPSQSNL